jgi:hypothetical protein
LVIFGGDLNTPHIGVDSKERWSTAHGRDNHLGFATMTFPNRRDRLSEDSSYLLSPPIKQISKPYPLPLSSSYALLICAEPSSPWACLYRRVPPPKGLFGWGVYGHILNSINILVVVSRLVFLSRSIEIPNLNTEYMNTPK